VSDTALMIQGRLVPCVKRCTEVIWFDFSVICNIPRSQLDYIEIATRFKCVIVSNIPKLTEENTTMVLLLMHLVDILYDQKRRLIVSAAVSLASLYTAGPLLSVFQRTQSRLTEMTGN
jgi:cell division protein ZapE